MSQQTWVDATNILWALYLILPAVVLVQFVIFQVVLRLLFLTRGLRER
jgi:hypothetical protein